MSPDEVLSELRSQLDSAQTRLAHYVSLLCPGPHRLIQHRDRRPPWCPECGRDNRGIIHNRFKTPVCDFDGCNNAATGKCVREDLFGNECVKYECPEHPCPCATGLKTRLVR
jgi:hypothetical protein